MSGKYLLDTNIIIALLENDKTIEGPLSGAQQVFIPNIGLGELYYGAHNSHHVITNLKRIDTLAKKISILSTDSKTPKVYGKVKAALKKIGKPIPENDIWIAALSLQHRLRLVSRDKHFKVVKGLLLETW